MKLSNFLETHPISAFEYIKDELIMNVISDDITYGLSVDTSNIPSGVKLLRTENYNINGNILTIDNLELNIDQIDML